MKESKWVRQHERPQLYLDWVKNVQAVGHRLQLQHVGLAVRVPLGPLLLERRGVEDPARERRGAVRAWGTAAAPLALLPMCLLLLLLFLPMLLLLPKKLTLHLLHQPTLGRQPVEAGAGQHEAAARNQQL